MDGIRGTRSWRAWYLIDTYGFISIFPFRRSTRVHLPRKYRGPLIVCGNPFSTHAMVFETSSCQYWSRKRYKFAKAPYHGSSSRFRKPACKSLQNRQFHDYFVTHLPSSSLHPDSRLSTGPHHKLPRSASTPHTPGAGPSPAAAPPMIGASRELTVVRIPLRSAKHHFGVSLSRGTRQYNEDTYQAGTIEMPAFARRAPISLTRSAYSPSKSTEGEATAAESASGDPQVFYFGVFDGHGGSECSEFLKDELHTYIELAGKEFELQSSLEKAIKKGPDAGLPGLINAGSSDSELSLKSRESPSAAPNQSKLDIKSNIKFPERSSLASYPTTKGRGLIPQRPNTSNTIELELSLVKQWKDTVGGYFRRFKPEYFSVSAASSCFESSGLQDGKDAHPVSVETMLMYAFLRADFDFITAQASKPDPDFISDLPLNNDEILGEPSRPLPSPNHERLIGGPTRFKGGSTASVAIISTPTPTPFWHPATPCTVVAAHVGDTRILLCETSTGLAVPLTTNHHPSSPIEGTRLRRYAGTFITDSFGEERMSGLANTRAFGDMHSKRIGVSAEPELRRHELGPAQYSFMVLVSDGVSGSLSDQEIVDVVKESKTPEQGARDVVGFATEVTKEGDNATCLVIRLGGWERRAEGGMGSLGTREVRDFRKQEATDPRSRRR